MAGDRPTLMPTLPSLGRLASGPVLYWLLAVGLDSQPSSRAHELAGLGPSAAPLPVAAVRSGGSMAAVSLMLPLLSLLHVPCLASTTMAGFPSGPCTMPMPPSGPPAPGSGETCSPRACICSCQRLCCFLYSRRLAKRYTQMVTRPAPATDAPSPMPTTAPVLRCLYLCGWSSLSDMRPLPPDTELLGAPLGSGVVSASAVAVADGRAVAEVCDDGLVPLVELAELLRDDAEDGGLVDGALVLVVAGTLVPALVDGTDGVCGKGVEVGEVDDADEEAAAEEAATEGVAAAGGKVEEEEVVVVGSGAGDDGLVGTLVDEVVHVLLLLVTELFGEGGSAIRKTALGVLQHCASSSDQPQQYLAAHDMSCVLH